jgi:hypothetical protein
VNFAKPQLLVRWQLQLMASLRGFFDEIFLLDVPGNLFSRTGKLRPIRGKRHDWVTLIDWIAESVAMNVLGS